MTQKLLCGRCDRYYDGQACLAFPEGIPDEIFAGDNDHAEPFPGDGGFTFTPARAIIPSPPA